MACYIISISHQNHLPEWGRRDPYSNASDATIMSEQPTPEDAYQQRDLLAKVLQSSLNSFAAFYVVDKQRQPVPRPA